MRVTKDMITQIAAGMPGALESVLLALKKKIDADKNPKPSSPCYSELISIFMLASESAIGSYM